MRQRVPQYSYSEHDEDGDEYRVDTTLRNHRMIDDDNMSLAVRKAFEAGIEVGRYSTPGTEPEIGVSFFATNNSQVDAADGELVVCGIAELKLFFPNTASAVEYKLRKE